MHRRFITALVVGLVVSSSVVNPRSDSVARGETPVTAVPGPNHLIHRTYGPCSGRGETGLPEKDTQHAPGFTRSPRDWDREYGGLSEVILTPDLSNSDRSGLSGIITSLETAVDQIRRTTADASGSPSAESGARDPDDLAGGLPTDGPFTDGTLGRDDFEVESLDFRLNRRGSIEAVLIGGDCGEHDNASTPASGARKRRHVPPVVVRSGSQASTGDADGVCGTWVPVAPSPPEPLESALLPYEPDHFSTGR